MMIMKKKYVSNIKHEQYFIKFKKYYNYEYN